MRYWFNKGLAKNLPAPTEGDRSVGPDPIGAWLSKGFNSPPTCKQTDVEPTVLRALFDRTSRQWARLGETEPHWSVLTEDAYRSDRINEARRRNSTKTESSCDLRRT